MQEKCPKCGEPLITRTIKKELGLGSIDYPIAQVCPKCNWSRDLTGAGDIVSKPVTAAPSEIKKEEKPPVVTAAPPKMQPAAPPFNINKLITVVLAILVLGGLVWAFFLNPPAPQEKTEPLTTPTATPEVTITTVQPTGTPVTEVTPTGNKTRIKLDNRRGFSPDTQTIKPGDEIVWRNDGAFTVTIASNNGLFDATLLAYDKESRYMFKNPGTYSFYLKENQSLTGTIIVEP